MFIPNSSTVEQRAVNSHVVGSNPALGATRMTRSRLAEGHKQEKGQKDKNKSCTLTSTPFQGLRSSRQL